MRSEPEVQEQRDPEADAELVARVLRDGDERAFRTLYRRHTPALLQFVLRLLGSDQREAEDAVQDTWIRAVERFADFRWQASLRTWLFGIGFNRVREIRRKARLSQGEATQEIREVSPLPHLVERIDLEEAIRQLPEGYREVLLLHDVEGFTHEEIAGQFGITSGTSKSQLHFARQALCRLLTGKGAQT
jgi:RNA polymerase sigma-70 factor, ECF subfamily